MNAADMEQAKVKDVMTYLVVAFHPNDPVEDAARRLLHNRISGAPVVEYGKVVGVVSEADLLGDTRSKVGEVMTETVIPIDLEASLSEAARLLDRHSIRRLPVLEEDYLVGIIARADIVRAVAGAATTALS